MARQHEGGIIWCDFTFNPWHGCTKISEGCAGCYAEAFSKRCGFQIWGQDTERRFFGNKHWAELAKWNTAAEKAGVMRSVFCGSMCDIFEDRPDLVDPRMTVMDMAEALPNLLFLFLSKRPRNALLMLPERWRGKWPRNVMAGVTIENQRRLEERMPIVEELRQRFPGISVFASCEPLLSALNWERPGGSYLQLLDWVVAGGESGPRARNCRSDWARKLRDDCAGRDDMCRPWPLPFLWKQWGEFLPDDQNPRMRGPFDPGGAVRVRKKAAGRLLDGREHNEFPRLSCGPQVGGCMTNAEVRHA